MTTDTFTSDSDGLREAARELAIQDKATPPDFVDEIKVIDESLLPERIDGFGQDRGIDPKAAARELSNYHKRVAAEREAFDQQIADPEEHALHLSAQADELYAALDTLQPEQLREVMNSSQPDHVKTAASQILERRLANYDQHLRALWDWQSQNALSTMLLAQGSEHGAIRFAQQMALSGLMARHGFSSLEELQQIQSQDPQRHAQIAGEAAQLDLYLSQCAQGAAKQAAAEQQQAAVLHQQRLQQAAHAFQQYAAAHDEAFSRANPDLAQDPAKARQVAEDVLAYLNQVVGLPTEQVVALYNSEPLCRSAGTQMALLHATRYWKAMVRSANRPVRQDLPPVVRPGSSMGRVTSEDADVNEASAAFREKPSVRAAARLLSTRRRAATN